MSSPNGWKNTKAWSLQCQKSCRSLSGVHQESVRSLLDALINNSAKPLISPLQFMPKYYELSRWALQTTSLNKFSTWEEKPQKLKGVCQKSFRSLSEVFQEFIRSLVSVCQLYWSTSVLGLFYTHLISPLQLKSKSSKWPLQMSSLLDGPFGGPKNRNLKKGSPNMILLFTYSSITILYCNSYYPFIPMSMIKSGCNISDILS